MKSLLKPIAGCLLLLLLGTLLGGCALSSPQDSSIPWSKPADWEGQIPGMGTGH